MLLPEYLESESDTGFIRLAGHRIGLADIVRLYSSGASVETIATHLPTLPLALIHKVVSFYLENQNQVDQYVTTDDAMLRELQANAPTTTPSLAELRKRLAAMQTAQS